MNPHAPEAEFSRIVSLDKLGSDGEIHEIAANAEECAALAQRFDLVALDALKATVRLRRISSGRLVRLEGALTAEAVQNCVVTLEPVAQHMEESFTIVFEPRVEDAGGGDVVVISAEQETPEPLAGDSLDIGECVAQHLFLALNPYLRSEAAQAEAAALAREDGNHPSLGPEENPFRVLRALQTRRETS